MSKPLGSTVSKTVKFSQVLRIQLPSPPHNDVTGSWSDRLCNLFESVQEELRSQWRALPLDNRVRELELNAELSLVAQLAVPRRVVTRGRPSSEPVSIRREVNPLATTAGNRTPGMETITGINRSERSGASEGRADLGKTIDVLYQDLRRLSMFARGRRKTERGLRSEFPQLQLWSEIDASVSLRTRTRERFLGARLDAYGQREFMGFIGNIIALEAESTYTTWKKYRDGAGLTHKRRISSGDTTTQG